MTPDCVFCRIVAGQDPTREAYSGDMVYAFHDRQPVAPVHVLVVPRQHVEDFAALGPEHGSILGAMAVAAQAVAKQEGVANSGYRLVFNVGRDAGAAVPHLHLHLLAGRRLAWPPG